MNEQPNNDRALTHEELQRTVDLVKQFGGNRAQAARQAGMSKNAVGHRLKLAAKAGIAVPPAIRGNPQFREPRQPGPRRGRPSRAQQPPSLADEAIDRGPVAAAVDAIASELIVAEPQTQAMLERRTKFRTEIVAEALRDGRFRKTGDGFALVPLRRSAPDGRSSKKVEP